VCHQALVSPASPHSELNQSLIDDEAHRGTFGHTGSALALPETAHVWGTDSS
jgi:hypothetical protein